MTLEPTSVPAEADVCSCPETTIATPELSEQKDPEIPAFSKPNFPNDWRKLEASDLEYHDISQLST
jgi:hypothetical protein